MKPIYAPTFVVAFLCTSSTLALALPSVTLAPTTGHPKATTQVSGSGFGAGKAVDIYWDAADRLLVITDGSGNIAKTPLKVPADALPGQHWVTAVERDNGDGAQKAFTVRTNWVQFGFTAPGTHRNPYENVISPPNVNQLSLAWSAPANGVYS